MISFYSTNVPSSSQQRVRTCIFTICPSPLLPPTIAVTSTRVSLATKFRMHLSYFELCPVCACRSNFRAEAKGRSSRASRDVNEKGAITNFSGAIMACLMIIRRRDLTSRRLRLNSGRAPAREPRSAPSRAERSSTLNRCVDSTRAVNFDDASVT